MEEHERVKRFWFKQNSIDSRKTSQKTSHNNNIFKEITYGVFMSNLYEDKIVDKMERRRRYRERKDRGIALYVMKRSACPFYGFVVKSNVMLDTVKKRCALTLITTRPYNLCQMEIIRDKPNWFKCPLNTEENGKKIVENLEKIRVCPREFRPAKAKSWDGMTLKIWMRHIADMAIEE
jgi:hypothetical protein